MNCKAENFIQPETIQNLVRKLQNPRLEWISMSECIENYDNSKFSQKNSDGLEKFVTNMEGHKLIFSIMPQGKSHIFNLEISYSDEPNAVYEIPFLNDEKVSFYLNSLLDKIHEQQMQRYTKMENVLFNLYYCR